MASDVPTGFIVAQSLPQTRLDAYLKTVWPEVSRGTIQRLLGEGKILIDGSAVKPTHHPRAGEVVTVDWPEAVPDAALPENIPLQILYEDKDLLVINKPPGMVVHPAAGNPQHTLVNALLHHCAGELSGVGGVARPGLVHRLDKDTSGCLVAAKNDAAHVHLSAQFAERSILKIYQAVICGALPLKTGEIRADIGRDPLHRQRMTVRPKEGRPAHTSYRILEKFKETAWVELRLHTGRTHQIRVHLEHAGAAVVGDAVYGRRHNLRLKKATTYVAPRQLLHAAQLGFMHPRTGKEILVEAPLPEDFVFALETFRADMASSNPIRPKL